MPQLLRALSIGKAIDSCVEAFTANYEAIMAGTFSTSLADAGPLFDEITKLIAHKVSSGEEGYPTL